MSDRWTQHVEEQASLREEYGILSQMWMAAQSARVALVLIGAPVIYLLANKYAELLLAHKGSPMLHKITMLAFALSIWFLPNVIYFVSLFLTEAIGRLHVRGLAIELALGIEKRPLPCC